MKVTIDVPPVLYRAAGKGSQDYYRTAAGNLRADYPAGGSNIRHAVASVLEAVAEAMDQAAATGATEPDAWARTDAR